MRPTYPFSTPLPPMRRRFTVSLDFLVLAFGSVSTLCVCAWASLL